MCNIYHLYNKRGYRCVSSTFCLTPFFLHFCPQLAKCVLHILGLRFFSFLHHSSVSQIQSLENCLVFLFHFLFAYIVQWFDIVRLDLRVGHWSIDRKCKDQILEVEHKEKPERNKYVVLGSSSSLIMLGGEDIMLFLVERILCMNPSFLAIFLFILVTTGQYDMRIFFPTHCCVSIVKSSCWECSVSHPPSDLTNFIKVGLTQIQVCWLQLG